MQVPNHRNVLEESTPKIRLVNNTMDSKRQWAVRWLDEQNKSRVCCKSYHCFYPCELLKCIVHYSLPFISFILFMCCIQSRPGWPTMMVQESAVVIKYEGGIETWTSTRCFCNFSFNFSVRAGTKEVEGKAATVARWRWELGLRRKDREQSRAMSTWEENLPNYQQLHWNKCGVYK